MKKLMHMIIVALACINTLSALASSCDDRVASFLRSPTKKNYLLIASPKNLEAARDCWPVIGMSQKNRDSLTRLVARGNHWAMRFVAINLKTLDGGELEDALRILGEASHSAPEFLLSLNADGTISDNELGDAVIMLPLSFVDKKNESINELKMRSERFKSVRNSRLFQQRSYVLKKLSNDIRQVESAGPK